MQFAHFQSCPAGKGRLWAVAPFCGELQPSQGHPGKRGSNKNCCMAVVLPPVIPGWPKCLILPLHPFLHCFEKTLSSCPYQLLGRQTLPSSEKAMLQVWNTVWSHFSFCILGEIFSFFENIKKSHYLTSMNTWTCSIDVWPLKHCFCTIGKNM